MGKNITVFLIILITFQSYLFSLFPVQIFGISIYLVLFIISIFVLLLFNLKKLSLNHLIYYFVFIIFCLIVSYFRNSYYNYGNFFKNFINGFYWYLVPIFIMLTYKVEHKSFKSVYRILFIVLIIQSILSIFFILGLPTINLLTEEHSFVYYRYVGIMGGANVNSNFNSLIVSILVLAPTKFKNKTKLLILILGIFSVIPSLSRLPLILIFGLIIYLARDFYKKNRFNKIILFFLILAMSFFIFKNNDKFNDVASINKIVSTVDSGSDQLRYAKYSHGISILFSNFSSMLLGPPGELQVGRFVEFSDNSYIHMALELGIPMFLLFVIFVKYLINISYSIKSMESKIYIIFFLITCFLNNSISWIPWLFIFTMGLKLICYNPKST